MDCLPLPAQTCGDARWWSAGADGAQCCKGVLGQQSACKQRHLQAVSASVDNSRSTSRRQGAADECSMLKPPASTVPLLDAAQGEDKGSDTPGPPAGRKVTA